MAEPFLAEIRLFPYTFAPRNWAFCNGQTLPIAQNRELYSLVGTTYGGNGSTTFGLPDCRARVVVGAGQASGMENYALGALGGARDVALAPTEGATHTHQLRCINPFGGDASEGVPGPTLALAKASANAYAATANPSVTLDPAAIGPSNVPTGTPNPLPHGNMQPYLGLSYCIALQGVTPQRP